MSLFVSIICDENAECCLYKDDVNRDINCMNILYGLRTV